MGYFQVSDEGPYTNDYAWNKAANMLYLESPAGSGSSSVTFPSLFSDFSHIFSHFLTTSQMSHIFALISLTWSLMLAPQGYSTCVKAGKPVGCEWTDQSQAEACTLPDPIEIPADCLQSQRYS